MDYPRVSIIILNWNGWSDTVECLESLYRINYLNYDVIVVDNASQDNSIEKIKEYCKGKIEVNSKFFKYSKGNKPIKVFEITEDEARNNKFSEIDDYEKIGSNRRMILIKNKDNYGFTGGNNVGIKFALETLNPNYVLLLNNDTVVDKDFLIEMVKVGESDEKIGIVGSKIYYYDNPNKIWHKGAKINFWTGRGYCIEGYDDEDRHPTELNYPYYICGCSMLLRNMLVKKIGGLDEIWFAYYEDADICFKALKHGYKCMYVPTSKVWHKISSSTKDKKGIQLYYFTRNRIIFMLEWAPKLNKLVFVISSIILFPLILIREILRGRYKYLSYIIKGYIDGYCLK